MRELRVNTARERGVPVLIVAGEIDIHSSTKLDDALASTDGSLVVDLCDVTFIDSTGLRTLVADQQRRCVRGDRLAVACSDASPSRRLLELTEMTGLFETYASREEALDALASVV